MPVRRFIDVPVFVLANVVVDLEPLAVRTFGFDYPYHGYCHTFLIGTLVGVVWGLVAYRGRGVLAWLMCRLHLPYQTRLPKMLISGVLGVWLHVLLDAPLYRDIRPFFPIEANPLLGLVSLCSRVRSLCMPRTANLKSPSCIWVLVHSQEDRPRSCQR